MKEIKFNCPQDYFNYDFDDSAYCFFYKELNDYGRKQERLRDASMVDYEGKFRKLIYDLFKIYDALIIVPEAEELLGQIGNARILIKKSPKEEDLEFLS